MIQTNTHMILQAGHHRPETTVTTSDLGQFADYTGGQTAANYLAEKNANRPEGSPEFVMVAYADGRAMCLAAEDAQFLEPWKECTEERYQDMLEVLPPQKWERVNGVSIFRMSEYYTSDITRHFAHVGGKYFEGRFRTSGPSYTEHSVAIRLLMGGAAQ